ncbi:Misato segment II tubulin-like domain-containing protein [Syncephalis fuscata]|nr:Misato segment II tubulin-like domain-containing protein [Syncephalis fuscata]
MSSSTRELLTLQIGTYANYVGAHFWNAQDIAGIDQQEDAIDHDVLFQAGENLQGETTYTPRLLVVDNKDHLGYLSANALLGLDEDSQETTPGCKYDTATKMNRHEFIQDLESEALANESMDNAATRQYHFEQTVHGWSDYLRLYLHPKTLGAGILSREARLNWFPQAADVWQQTEASELLIDDELRWFAEACDHLQGFQIMSDVVNGYGGYTSRLLSELRDEYGKTDILVFGINQQRAINTGFSTTSLASLATTYVPVEYPSAQYLAHYLENATSAYASSGLIATGIDIVSTSLRLKENPISMSHITSLVNQREYNNISTLELALPFLQLPNPSSWETVADTLTKRGSFMPLIPRVANTPINTLAQSLVFYSGSTSALPMVPDSSDRSNDVDLLSRSIKYQLALSSQSARIELKCLERFYQFPSTFPNLIKRHRSCNHCQDAMTARLHTSNVVGTLLYDTETQLKSLGTRFVANAHGIDRDDYSEMMQAFSDINEAYGSDNQA